MIGHFVDRLTEEQESRVLTTAMAPWPKHASISENVCLGIAAGHDNDFGNCYFRGWRLDPYRWLGRKFDALCHRFGTPRVTAAIRNRILANRASRVLRGATQHVEAPSVAE